MICHISQRSLEATFLAYMNYYYIIIQYQILYSIRYGTKA